MARKIEQLLRVAADMHRFSQDPQAASAPLRLHSDELCEEELDLIAAAVQAPVTGDVPGTDPDRPRK